MVRKSAYFYREKYDETDLYRQIDLFRTCEITLPHPYTGQISLVSQKDGTQIFVTQEQLISVIQARQTTSFQWWRSDGGDLYHRLRFPEMGSVEEYSLNGLGELLPLIVLVLMSWFKDVSKNERVRGFVIDSSGISEGYDWDDFFLRDQLYIGELPNLVGLSLDRLRQLTMKTGTFEKEIVSNLVIIHKT